MRPPYWVLPYLVLWLGIAYVFCIPFLGSPPPDTSGLFTTLGVAPGADDAALKQAYRKLARDLHPDKHASGSAASQAAATTRFAAVARAYETLTDPELRDIYQRLGEDGLKRHADGDPSVEKDFKRGVWAAGPEPGHRQPNLYAWDSIDDVITNIFAFIERRLTGQ